MGLLRALRADERTARVPVLLLSARAGQEAAVEGLAAGADDYLVKPFSAQELMARVGAHLELGRVRREAEERFTRDGRPRPGPDLGGRRRRSSGCSSTPGGRSSPAMRRPRTWATGWRDRLHPEDRDRYLEVSRTPRPGHRPWEVEYRLRRADGAYHWLLERAVPLGGDDELAGYVGSCTDINARYRESQRQSLLAEVGAALDRGRRRGQPTAARPADWSQPAGRRSATSGASATTAGCRSAVRRGLDAGHRGG